MNPYLIIAALVSVGALTGLAGWGGYTAGVDHEKANQIDKQQIVAEAVDAANTSAAEAIAKNRPKNTTIVNKVQREVMTEKIYQDCKLTPQNLVLLNEALTGHADQKVDPSESGYKPSAGEPHAVGTTPSP